MIQNVASIEDEGRLDHALVDLCVVQVLELIPLCQNAQPVAAFARVVCVVLVCHLRHANCTTGVRYGAMKPRAVLLGLRGMSLRDHKELQLGMSQNQLADGPLNS